MWPTPDAHEGSGGGSAKVASRALARKGREGSGAKIQIQLRDLVKLWPTPTVSGNNNRKGLSGKSGDGLATVARLYPTPWASDYKGTGPYGSKSHRHDVKKRNLKGVVIEPENTGSLNPAWVEWLMGFPIGWTDLEDSETP